MIKGILFDKDGTLIDFFSLWLYAAKEVVPEFLKQNGIKASKEMVDFILDVIGVTEDSVDPKGALAYKSYAEIAEDIRAALITRRILLSKEEIYEQLIDLFGKSVLLKDAPYEVFTDMKVLMKQLKSCEIVIGLATADTAESAENCLKTIGIKEYFDYIGADDGEKKPKPDKEMFLEFAEQFDLRSDEIAVVGDTYNDMLFAKQNGGVAIGVLSGVSTERDFEGQADYVITSVNQLLELLERI